jgi:hypothetical protein
MPNQFTRKSPRPIILPPDSPAIALVELTRDRFSVIDASDAAAVGLFNWHAYWNPSIRGYYAARSNKNSTIHLHQFIMGNIDGFTVDHLNRNTLDNRRANLRHATRSEQQFNRGIHSNNSSGFRNVHRAKDKWQAAKYVDGKRIHLGTFSTPEEAHAAIGLSQ